MRQILVVANQTLGGDEIADVIRARLAEDLTEFFLLVPVQAAGRTSENPTFGLSTGVELPMIQPHSDDATPGDTARRRLQTGLERLRTMGAIAEGAVVDSDPLAAIGGVLARRQIDEVVISTLPLGISRWLRHDLPHRVRRRYKLPVTVVTAKAVGGR